MGPAGCGAWREGKASPPESTVRPIPNSMCAHLHCCRDRVLICRAIEITAAAIAANMTLGVTAQAKVAVTSGLPVP